MFVSFTVNPTAPRSVLPVAPRGVRKRHVAAPSEGRAFAPIFLAPMAAVHETPVGATASPPAVTATRAETTEPAFGRAGETLTAPAFTACVTLIVTVAELSEGSAS